MSKTMNLSVRLPAPLTSFVSGRVGEDGDYDNASEYVRDLIRRDKEREDRLKSETLKATLQEAFAQPDELAKPMDFETFMARHQPKA